MKKKLLGFAAVCALLPSLSAEAFFPLPPFKVDFSTIANKTSSGTNTTSQTAGKGIQQASIVQTAIAYGQGAKEYYEFYKKMKEKFSGVNLNNLGEVLDQMSEIEAEQSKAKEEAATEVAAKTKETNAKIVALDENSRELTQKIVEDPANAEKYQKQIQENEKEKDELSKKLVKETRQINKKTEQNIGKLNDQIKDLKGKADELISTITSIGSDYDSTEDLNNTAEALLPGKDTEVDTHVAATYASIYRVNYFTALTNASGRAGLLKSTVYEDNQEALENQVSSAELESLGGAVGTLVKMKADNIKALLNYTELLLQKMQLDIAKDLALENFETVDPAQATGDFNFDNYRFTPPTDEEFEMADPDKKEELDQLEKEITPGSSAILTEGMKTMTASDAEETGGEAENTASRTETKE